MKPYFIFIILICRFLMGCQSAPNSNKLDSPDYVLKDSCKIGSDLFYLFDSRIKVNNDNKYLLKIFDSNKKLSFSKVFDTPASGFKMYLTDSLQLLLIDNCIACDGDQLLILKYDDSKRIFNEVLGSNNYTTDFNSLNSKDMFFDMLFSNQGGGVSRLIKLKGDSLIKLCEISIPYSNLEKIEINDRKEKFSIQNNIGDKSYEQQKEFIRDFWTKYIVNK